VEIKVVPRPSCIICGGESGSLHESLRDHLFQVPGNWRIVQCRNAKCRLAWPDPCPALSDIPKLYTSYYTHAKASSSESAVARFRGLLYRIYLFVTSIPSRILGVHQERERLRLMFLGEEKPGRLLDVGCGSGKFLHKMAERGWQGVGTDFDEKAIEHARTRYERDGLNLRFYAGDLSDAGLSAASFDAVTMNHVIEHVPDPKELLQQIHRLLKLGGRLVAATPNVKSFGHSRFGPDWRGLEPPRHLQIFSPRALEQCAKNAGFRAVKVFTTAANADTIIGASIGVSEASARGRKYRGISEINMLRGIRSLLLQYREAMLLRRDPDCGEELVLICEK
jgi:2-polyprenyl-3-methyl-5-hydroxy-6-metoxy-1,4-benzoquinol methylase